MDRLAAFGYDASMLGNLPEQRELIKKLRAMCQGGDADRARDRAMMILFGIIFDKANREPLHRRSE